MLLLRVRSLTSASAGGLRWRRLGLLLLLRGGRPRGRLRHAHGRLHRGRVVPLARLLLTVRRKVLVSAGHVGLLVVRRATRGNSSG